MFSHDHHKKGWCVVWRTGTTENFAWNRSEEMSREAADSSAQAFGRDGVRAMVVNYRQSVAIGMPSTWAATTWEIAEDRKLEAMEVS